MSQPAKAPEPSMEEILASIRRIIADDDTAKPAVAAAAATAGLAVSSSAMMRRMEARISSIDGSGAFAGWLIAESLPFCPAPGIQPPAANHSLTRYLLGSS